MEQDRELYDALIELRDFLKNDGKRLGMRAPRICSDEACAEMARLRPKKISDFEIVPGLGRSFTEKYAARFLEVLDSFAVKEGTDTKTVSMNKTVEVALQELEKKLVNISRSNRLLYMPRVSNPKEAFDLSVVAHNTDVLKPLFDRGSRVTVAKPNMRNKEGKKADYYPKLTQLQRNINRIIREKGQNDLYVGYPFAEGRLPGERFDVKAPLVLFPVEIVRDAYTLDIRFDDSRDMVYNNTLILGYFKLNKINRPLPDNILDEMKKEDFIGKVLEFYRGVGLEIKDDRGPAVQPFQSYRADEFPSYESGELHLKRNAVIGRFPTYSNSIQKDFIKIVDGQMINPLLDELLLNMDAEIPDDGEVGGDVEEEILERDLMYISDLNTAQEEIMSRIRSTDRLVIQGPPGTGKSQTITNLIADFANEGRTVLMVSEKKAALDVVYSRLGGLSRYAMLIDDVNNKDLFFKQMDSIIHIEPPSAPPTETSVDLSRDIERMFSDLDRLSKTIYTPCGFGIEPYRLYLYNRKLDPTDRDQLEKYAAYSDAFSDRLLDYDYGQLCSMHDRFRRASTVMDMNDCLDMRAMHPWMMDLKQDLNEYDVQMAVNDMLELKKEIGEWRNSGFFSKMLNKNRMKSRVNDVFARYWTYYRCHDPVSTYIDMDTYLAGLNCYDEFTTVNNTYEALSDPEKIYLDVMHSIVREDICSPNLVNDELFNFTMLQQIQRFEGENRELLKDLGSFENMQADLEDEIARKKNVSKSEIELRLAGFLTAITGSKRFGDMQRVIEMKRKWSVNKYIGRFDFELFKGIKIWLLTPDVVSEIIPMQTGLFDLVIFDEASQMFIEKGIPSVMRAKKVVIAGDHKQLRPSKLGAGRIGMDEDDAEDDDDIPVYEESNSLLDVARFKYPGIMLKYHYRSQYEELISFSNHAFYNGRLYIAPNLESDPDPPITVHKLDNGRWRDRSNKAEAERVVELIADILENREGGETIGVITFNSSQMDLIDSLLEARCQKDPSFAGRYYEEIGRKENGEDIGLFVKNIENVQGDERDIIIFSIGYAKGDNGRIVRNFGWLNQAGGENRLNVAISRAKKKIHIVTSFLPSELNVDDVKNDGPKLLKKYLQYCFAVSDGNRNEADAILKGLSGPELPCAMTEVDDEFGDRVYDALVSRGFDVDRRVGIGGYSLDMAIRRQGRYVLGIECDGRLYHSGMNSRERDYHRRRYLESRGWRIYRIWSPSWWKNPEGEMDRIAKLAESA